VSEIGLYERGVTWVFTSFVDWNYNSVSNLLEFPVKTIFC
jgi:hypothetical protein